MWSNNACVQPLGNALLEVGGLSSASSARARGLGSLACLTDELLCKVVLLLSPADLARLSQVSVGCRAFAMDEDAWRVAVFDRFNTAFNFTESWRTTYITHHLGAAGASAPAGGVGHEVTTTFYSDFLFQKYRCMYATVQGEWVAFDNARREVASALSPARFRAQYEEPGRPVVITGLVSRWRAYRKWSVDRMVEQYHDTKFHVAGYEYTLGEYCSYILAVQQLDDQVMLLFDKRFGEKIPELAGDYETPEYFSEDLFSVFGDERRPDYRWLIMGPERSGSQWHIDPNCTSAWNAVIMGKKKWILFPPNVTPPGVAPSADGGSVHAPVSVMEWFLNYYKPAREMGRNVGAIECTVSEGEMIFIPAGWWHIVLNLDFSLAVTQNYVSSANVVDVARWLHDRPEQISGCKSAADKQFVRENFAQLVAKKYPGLRKKLVEGKVLDCDLAEKNDITGNTKNGKNEGTMLAGDDNVGNKKANDEAGSGEEGKSGNNEIAGENGESGIDAKDGKVAETDKNNSDKVSSKKKRKITEEEDLDVSLTTGSSASGESMPKKKRVGIWESLRQETARVGGAGDNSEKKDTNEEGNTADSGGNEGSADGKAAAQTSFRFDFNIGG